MNLWLAILICLSSLNIVSAQNGVKRKLVHLLKDCKHRKQISFRSDELLTVILKDDTDYYSINVEVDMYCIFYVEESLTDKSYGFRVHWEDFHSQACFNVNLKNSEKGPRGRVCSDAVSIKTIQDVPTGRANLTYFGKPNQDRFMLSMVGYKTPGPGGCGDDFVPCTDKHTSICISRKVVSGVTSCQLPLDLTSQAITPAQSQYHDGIPLGFIGAVAALLAAGVLFLIGVLVWYRWRIKNRGPARENADPALEHLSNPEHKRASPNVYVPVAQNVPNGNPAS